MHVASSFEFAMAPAMFQNPTERLRGTAPAMLVWGRTKNWIGEACQLGRPAQHVIRILPIRQSRRATRCRTPPIVVATASAERGGIAAPGSRHVRDGWATQPGTRCRIAAGLLEHHGAARAQARLLLPQAGGDRPGIGDLAGAGRPWGGQALRCSSCLGRSLARKPILSPAARAGNRVTTPCGPGRAVPRFVQVLLS
jgi:hypothetical protein